MSRYIMVRMTVAQAAAACNAADLIRDQHEADNNKREAAIYARASETIARALSWKGTRS